MRKIFALILAVMIVMSMTVSASACTPKLKIPKVPQISGIKFEVKLDENLEKAVGNHANKWVGKIDFSKIALSGITLG